MLIFFSKYNIAKRPDDLIETRLQILIISSFTNNNPEFYVANKLKIITKPQSYLIFYPPPPLNQPPETQPAISSFALLCYAFQYLKINSHYLSQHPERRPTPTTTTTTMLRGNSHKVPFGEAQRERERAQASSASVDLLVGGCCAGYRCPIENETSSTGSGILILRRLKRGAGVV